MRPACPTFAPFGHERRALHSISVFKLAPSKFPGCESGTLGDGVGLGLRSPFGGLERQLKWELPE